MLDETLSLTITFFNVELKRLTFRLVCLIVNLPERSRRSEHVDSFFFSGGGGGGELGG